MRGVKRAWAILTRTLHEFSEDGAMSLAAAIAYYSALSVAPLVILFLVLAHRLGREQSLQYQLVAQVHRMLGQEGAEVVRTVMAEAERPAQGGAAIVGLLTLIVAATTVFAQLQYALNTVWGVQTHVRKQGIVRFIQTRLVSLGLIVTLMFVMMLSLLISATTSFVAERAPIPSFGFLWQMLSFGGSLVVFTLLFAMVFRLLPDVVIRWRDVWVGAGVTALLFVLGKEAIGWYLGRGEIGSAYGAAGSLIVLLVWVYYASVILLLGAELTQVWFSMQGREIEPAPGAERVGRAKGTHVSRVVLKPDVSAAGRQARS